MSPSTEYLYYLFDLFTNVPLLGEASRFLVHTSRRKTDLQAVLIFLERHFGVDVSKLDMWPKGVWGSRYSLLKMDLFRWRQSTII